MGYAHVNLHFLVKTIVHHETVRHTYAMRLHGVARNVGIVTHVGVVEVGDLLVLGTKKGIGDRFRGHVER